MKAMADRVAHPTRVRSFDPVVAVAPWVLGAWATLRLKRRLR